MRKTLFLLTLVFFFFFSAISRAGGPVEKLKRGAINILTFPLEIPKETVKEFRVGRAKTFHVLIFILDGFVEGCAYSVGRLGSGTWDIISFPLNKPAGFEPLMKPDFVFDK